MSHLEREDLLRWRDAGDENERARVLGHLAACHDCRRQYADLLRESEAAEPEPDLVREAVPLGMAAYPEAAPRPVSRRGAVWAVSGLAAAVLVASAIILVPRPGPAPGQDDTVRGDEIQLMAPLGEVSGPVAFRWSSPVRAARYRVWVHDETGAVVYSTLTAQESARPPAELSAGLRKGARYAWQVEAYDAAGELLARSPELRFSVR
jgi:hypothetical protein